MPYRSPGAPKGAKSFLTGKPIRYYRPKGSAAVRTLIDEGFQAFNAARLGEACRIYGDKMLAKQHDTTIALTVAGALTPAGLGGCIIELMERGLIDFVISTGANLYHDLHYALNFTLRRGSPFVDDRVLYERRRDSHLRRAVPGAGAARHRHLHPRLPGRERHGRPGVDRGAALRARPAPAARCARAARSTRWWPRRAKSGVPIYTSSPGDSSIGMNIAYHELINRSTLQVDPNKDVNEVCAIIRAAEKNGCVILGGGSPKNFYLQGQPTLWEVYGILKGGNDYFIQITTDSVVWGGLSGATPAEAVSWGKVNPERAAGHRGRLLRFDDRVPAVLRIRGRPQERPPHAQGSAGAARRSWSPISSAKRASRSRRSRRSESEIRTTEIMKPNGHTVVGARAGRRSRCRSAARLRRRQRARTASWRSCASTLKWDVLFVMDHPDLRRARDIEHYRLARQLRRTLDHARSRLSRRSPVPAGSRDRRAGDGRAR